MMRSPQILLSTVSEMQLKQADAKSLCYATKQAKFCYSENRKQGCMAPSETSYHTKASPGYPNTPEKQDSDLKSHFMMMIEDFKKDINNSL